MVEYIYKTPEQEAYEAEQGLVVGRVDVCDERHTYDMNEIERAVAVAGLEYLYFIRIKDALTKSGRKLPE